MKVKYFYVKDQLAALNPVECYSTEYVGPYTGEYLGATSTPFPTKRVKMVTIMATESDDVVNSGEEDWKATVSPVEIRTRTVVDSEESFAKTKTIAIIVGR